MHIAVDLRLLNYKYRTGVSIYTINLLYQIYLIKKEDRNLKVISIGLKKENFASLSIEYIFIKELFDEMLDLNDYLELKYLTNTKILNFLYLVGLRFRSGLDSKNVREFDYLILPQPRPLLKHPKTKLIAVFHDFYSILDRKYLSFTQKFLENKFNYGLIVKSSSEMWCVSIATCNDLVKIFSKYSSFLNLNSEIEKVKLVYSGYPDLLDKSSLEIESIDYEMPTTKYMLAISGIEPRKNWDNLLLAHKYLQNTYPDYNYKLVLAGKPVNPKYYRTLLGLIKTHQIQNVEWYLNISEVHKLKLVECSEFLVYPSLYEGFGFPLLEAFKFGKPVITSKVSSMPEIAKNSALYVNPLNLLDLARAIYILTADQSTYNTLKSNTKQNLSNFSWDNLRLRLEKTINSN